MDRAAPLYRAGHWFDSSYHLHARVAPMVEREFEELGDVGSIPTSGTIFFFISLEKYNVKDRVEMFY